MAATATYNAASSVSTLHTYPPRPSLDSFTSSSFYAVDYRPPSSAAEIGDLITTMQRSVKRRKDTKSAPAIDECLTALQKLFTLFKGKKPTHWRMQQFGEKVAYFKASIFDPLFESSSEDDDGSSSSSIEVSSSASDLYKRGAPIYEHLSQQLRILAQGSKGKSDVPGYIIQNMTQVVYRFPRDLEAHRNAITGKNSSR